MKWVTDRTGRFPQRPHFEPAEIDYACETSVSSFLRGKYGGVTYPFATNDLVILIEQHASELDIYADFKEEGDGIEGVTDFFRDEKPIIRIAWELSENPRRENRLRSTLAHELGHVRFHNFLASFDQTIPMPLFGESRVTHSIRCKRDNILKASTSDWMEWQAGYASGAFLMPVTHTRETVGAWLTEAGLFSPVSLSTPASVALVHRIATTFQVSTDAARVRLLQLNYLTEQTPSQSFFAKGTA